MENSKRVIEVVRDALYARNMKHVGCFAFNKASEQVQHLRTEALPNIELAIKHEVLQNGPQTKSALHATFPGIADILVDYFRIVRQEGELDRAATFLASLHGPVLVEAIRYMTIEWDGAVPQALMTVIERAARSSTPEEQQIAAWALGRARGTERS